MRRSVRRLAGRLAAGLLLAMGVAGARAQAASDADKAFVAKVSQGGAYEVAAGRIAALRGQSPVVRDFGAMEVHDHEGVGAGLKRIAAQTGVPIVPALNAEFQERLAKLKATPPDQFDAFYVADMKQIHNKDEGLFVQESQEGSAPYKDWAHGTAVLVKAHLGWLNSL
jgi:putative membrane protein